MVSGDDLRSLSFFDALPPWVTDRLASRAGEERFRAGDHVVRQHMRADVAHFLIEGEVQVLLRFEGVGDLVIETLTEDEPVIGWSVFRPPYRYTAGIRCESDCRTITISRIAFQDVFAEDRSVEVEVMQRMAGVVAQRLARTVEVLVGAEHRVRPAGGWSGTRPCAPRRPRAGRWRSLPFDDPVTAEDRQVATDAPFLERLSQTELSTVLEHARATDYPSGRWLFRAGDEADTLHMLISGQVEIIYSDTDDPEQAARDLSGQTVGEPGRILGWSALVPPFRYHAGVVTLGGVRTLALHRDVLLEISRDHPALGARLLGQLLHLLGSRLREARIRLVARRYRDELVAIRALIDQNAEELTVSSPLHKLPHFLENRMTVPEAITAMELLVVNGDEVERGLAQSCLDLMVNIGHELAIYQRLQSIYEHVARAPEDADPVRLRERCCQDFAELFALTDHVIEGMDRLPAGTGHIVVMNHLTNDPADALPNGFRLTIDTHFVSCMILHPRYGRAPIRVVRKAHLDEYAHQMYYDRLGYISVFRADIDPAEIDRADGARRRRDFHAQAEAALRRGENILICPEGNSTDTEASPLRFKAGAFRLARALDPEPWIVPISVANLDKRLVASTLAAIVHEPFRMSDRLDSTADDRELFAWVERFRATFADWIADTIDLAGGVGTARAR